MDIIARKDIVMTGTLYITFATDSIPASTTYTFTHYDKYLSGSDYSRSVYLSATFARSTSYNLVQPTSIQWRRQVYKEFRTTNGPIRLFFHHNFQYVYDYETPANSDAIVVEYRGGINSAYTYVCFLKEYPPGKKYLYREH